MPAAGLTAASHRRYYAAWAAMAAGLLGKDPSKVDRSAAITPVRGQKHRGRRIGENVNPGLLTHRRPIPRAPSRYIGTAGMTKN